MIAAEVTKDFPERSSEIRRLCNYLDPDLVPSPPVLLYGPSGKFKLNPTAMMRAKHFSPFQHPNRIPLFHNMASFLSLIKIDREWENQHSHFCP